MRVLLADDQPQVRSALRLLLEQEPWLTVVGEAIEVEGLLEQMRMTRPDLLLLDWELPGLQLVNAATNATSEGLQPLHACVPGILVIALSGRPEARQMALDAGANAFISKGDPPEYVLATLRSFVQPDEHADGESPNEQDRFLSTETAH